MRLAVLATALLLAVAPVAASEGGEGHGEGEGKPAADAGDPTLLELPMLVAPVTVKGRLYHYAYMRILLKAKDSSTADTARDKVPFIMDAMLRETHRASIAVDDDPQKIDGAGLQKRLLETANTVIGPGAFETLTFRDTIQTDDPAMNQAAAEAAELTAPAEDHAAAEPEAPAEGGH